MTVYPVVLAGGRGTRLWPVSRSDKPKQFLHLHGDRNLFQQTIERHRGMEDVAAPWIVCGLADRFHVDDGLTDLGVENAMIVLEPAPRNTAPAIAAVAAAMVKRDEEAIMLVLPSDHLITTDLAYYEALGKAIEAAGSGRMVTFGVVPTHPDTGYGYIKAKVTNGIVVNAVEHFVEKPPFEKAAEMVTSGDHYWNAGFFVFGAKALLDELATTAPDVVVAATAAVEAAEVTPSTIRLDANAYSTAPNISIDYALLERTDKASVAPISCRWSDVGSWRAYFETLPRDAAGNAIRGKGIAIDSKNTLIVSQDRDVVALGMDNIAVVATADAILVAPLDRAQDVKKVVATLKERLRSDLLDASPTVQRPWGGYTSIMNGARFQVKHLFVSPGKKLSLQKHHHRAEHWVVVKGTAEITIDDEVVTLSENQSTYLPLGCIHRLANPGKIILEVIEVQTGSYLGEDDIIRIEDDWNRSSRD